MGCQPMVTVTTAITVEDSQLFEELQSEIGCTKRELFSQALHVLAEKVGISKENISLAKEHN